MNPLTGLPFSPSYYRLLATRRRLPVYSVMDDFVDKYYNPNRVVVPVGATGSGKTTQSGQL